MHVRNTAGHVVDLDDGRTLAPLEVADTPDSERLTELIAAGLLTGVDPPAAPPAAVPAPVAPVAAPSPPVPIPSAPAADTVKES